MANRALILGEKYAITGGNEDGGFLDIAAAMQPGMEISEKVFQGIQDRALLAEEAKKAAKLAEEQKIAATNEKIGGLLSQMQSNIDLTGISADQQKNITEFLTTKKQEYIEAANAIAEYDVTDPEYMQYADVMQQVNNQFQTLANNLKVYKENQADFISDGYENRLSMANTGAVDQAAYMYNKSTPFTVDNGNLMFNYEGETINYTDYKNPSLKAFGTADAIMKIANNVHKTKQKLTDYQKSSIRLQLTDAFSQNPNALRSRVVDKLLTDGLLDIDYSVYSDPSKTAELQEEVISQLVGSMEKIALDSYNAANPPGGPTGGGKGLDAPKIGYNIRVVGNVLKGQHSGKIELYDREYGTKTLNVSKIRQDASGISIFYKAKTADGSIEDKELVILEMDENGKPTLGKDAARVGISSETQIIK